MDSKQIQEMFKQKDYQSIIQLWESSQEEEWDYVYLIRAYYYKRQYPQCLTLFRRFHQRFPSSTLLDNSIVWALYHSQIKTYDIATGDPASFLKKIDYCFDHSRKEDHLLHWLLVQAVDKQYEQGHLNQATYGYTVLAYFDRLDPLSLSGEEYRRKAADGTQEVYPSPRELWYSKRGKLLLSLGEYEKCIACGEEALANVSSFHYRADAWIFYRNAICYFRTKNYEQSLEMLNQARAKTLNHWFIYQLMFKNYQQLGQLQKALMAGSTCALADSRHDSRLPFYEDFSDYLEQQGFSRAANLHRQLILQNRKESHWNSQPTAKTWDIPEEIASLDPTALYEELTRFWEEHKEKESHTGADSVEGD